MPGFKDFVNLTALAESDLDDYLAKQVLMKFASAAARSAALTGFFREGIASYLDDLNTIGVNTGATDVHSTIGPVHGALSTYTPVLTQSGAVTKTVDHASYMRIGRMVIGNIRLDVTGAGTAANAITISTPFTALSGGTAAVVGAGYWYDASGTIIAGGSCALLTTTTFGIYSSGGNHTALGGTGSGNAAALASGDIINLSFHFEAAGDA